MSIILDSVVVGKEKWWGKRCNAEMCCIFFVSRLLDGLFVSMYMTKEMFEIVLCEKEWRIWHCMIGMAMGKRI